MAVVGTALLAVFFAWPSLTWPAIKARIAREFPKVRSISTADLAKSQIKPVLLDVRTAAEFQVSHLSGAQRVDPDASSVALPKDTPIVTYCSVGYRSAKLAQRLQEAGFTNVRNLESSFWRKWLEPKHRCLVPVSTFCEWTDTPDPGPCDRQEIAPLVHFRPG